MSSTIGVFIHPTDPRRLVLCWDDTLMGYVVICDRIKLDWALQTPKNPGHYMRAVSQSTVQHILADHGFYDQDGPAPRTEQSVKAHED